MKQIFKCLLKVQLIVEISSLFSNVMTDILMEIDEKESHAAVYCYVAEKFKREFDEFVKDKIQVEVKEFIPER